MKNSTQVIIAITAIAGVYLVYNNGRPNKGDEEGGHYGRDDIQRDAKVIFRTIAEQQQAWPGGGMSEAEAKAVLAASKAGRDTSALIKAATERRLKEPGTLGDSYLFHCERLERPCAEGLRNAVASVYLVLALQHGKSYGEAWAWAVDLTDEYLEKHYSAEKKAAEFLEQAGVKLPLRFYYDGGAL